MTRDAAQVLIDYNYRASARLLEAVDQLSPNSSRTTWAAVFDQFATRSRIFTPPN